MARATISLSPKQIAESSQLLRQAVMTFARLAAKRAVQDELRDQGVRLTTYPYAELMRQAAEYLDKHPELYQAALERARPKLRGEPLNYFEASVNEVGQREDLGIKCALALSP